MAHHQSRTLLLALLLSCLLPVTSALAQDMPGFTDEQAKAGQATYREQCQICHGSSLVNGQFGTPLRGSFFTDKWSGKSVGELQQFIYEKMPPDKVESLTAEQTSQLLAYILSRNNLAAGTTPLSGDNKALNAQMLPW
jgi:mono/diheme cytochrome c family protein